MRARTLIPLAAAVAAVALIASTGTFKFSVGEVSVGTVTASNLVIGRSYKVDDAFAERVGEDIAARFSIILPKRRGDNHRIGVQELPPGGIVQFNFRTEEGAFRESLFVARVDVPVGDMDARLAEASRQLAEQAPGVLGQSFDRVTVTDVPKEVEISGLRAMELTGTYALREDGAPYAWRFVILPHPDRIESLYTVGHVNVGLEPVEKAEDHLGTLSGRAMSTLKLTDLAPSE